MPRYANLSGVSGVDSYAINRDGSITVFFIGGGSYTYSEDEELYELAHLGLGLNRTLNYNRPPYTKRRTSDRIRRFFARR